MKQLDHLIVGQGLAGTLLAHFLREGGRKVHVIDDDYARAASKVAAGIINPVTGRRYVKSWRIDELIPFAEKTYRNLEAELGISIYHPKAILRALFNAGEENDWQIRAHDPDYQAYIAPQKQVRTGAYEAATTAVFAYGELRRGAQVELDKLTRAYRRLLLQQGALYDAAFDPDKLLLTPSGVQYKDLQARSLIFCEGAGLRSNPFFSYLPFEGNKGEALIVNIPDGAFEKILKHRIFIVPMADGSYWVGSTSNNHFADDLPSEAGKSYLLEKLEALLKMDFTIAQHRAAIRPTVKDRRPLLGRHPEYPQLFVFNGLGTKGASLAPFWAKHLADALINDQEIDPAVNIARFKGKAFK